MHRQCKDSLVNDYTPPRLGNLTSKIARTSITLNCKNNPLVEEHTIPPMVEVFRDPYGRMCPSTNDRFPYGP